MAEREQCRHMTIAFHGSMLAGVCPECGALVEVPPHPPLDTPWDWSTDEEAAEAERQENTVG